MNVYRHRNGNGLAHGEGVHLSADTFFDKDSRAMGKTTAHSSSVRATSLRSSFVAESFIHGCAVLSSRVSRSHLQGCLISNSEVVAAEAVRCELEGVVVEPSHGVLPFLIGVTLEDVTVSGNVSLRGPWELRGPYRIDAGEWECAPRHLEISGENGVRVGLSECTNGNAHVACRCKPLDYWLAKGARVGRRLGWTEEQISSALQFLEGLR